MKIVHVLLSTAHGSLSYAELSSGGRGITGSEQAFLYLAKHQADLGHQVTCYIPTTQPGFFGGVEMLNTVSHWPRLRRIDTADVVISWLSGDPLRLANPGTLRVLSYQINDHLVSGYGFADFTDVFVAVSKAHRDHLMTEPGHPPDWDRWEIAPNGVDLSRFTETRERVPRRCVYISSPDRGLHWILAMWPEIRFAYPDAELHIYYEVQKWLDTACLLNSEIGLRSHYVMNRIHALGKHGVYVHGAVSPAQLATELLEADVLTYPTDTIRFTEGFGVSVLEAHAAGLVPIITDADAFGEIYGQSGAIVVPRNGGVRWTDAFLETVLRVLGDSDRENIRPRVRAFARNYDWRSVALIWDELIQRRLALKRQGLENMVPEVVA